MEQSDKSRDNEQPNKGNDDKQPNSHCNEEQPDKRHCDEEHCEMRPFIQWCWDKRRCIWWFCWNGMCVPFCG